MVRFQRRPGARLVTALVFAGGLGLMPLAHASASAKSLSCTMVPPAEIKATLGLSVGKPTVNNSGPPLGLVCDYTVANTGGTISVTVSFLRPETAKDFASGQKSSIGGTTRTVRGLGQMAYSNVMGSGQYAISTLYVLQDNTRTMVQAVATLAKVEGLARKILPQT